MIRDISDNPFAARTAHAGPSVRMDMPSPAWSLKELCDRAVWEQREISGRQAHAPRYWYLGKVLLLARDEVGGGRWKTWCMEHKIERNRWKRGRLFALAFSSPVELADLTIEAAEKEAGRRLGRERRKTAVDARLRRRLTLMSKSLQKGLDEFGGVTDGDGPRARIAEIRRKLAALDHACATLEKRRGSGIAEPRRRKPT